jgi:hypothetical protein
MMDAQKASSTHMPRCPALECRSRDLIAEYFSSLLIGRLSTRSPASLFSGRRKRTFSVNEISDEPMILNSVAKEEQKKYFFRESKQKQDIEK